VQIGFFFPVFFGIVAADMFEEVTFHLEANLALAKPELPWFALEG